MKLCISSCILGTDKHLLCTSDGYAWCESIPCDVWHFSGAVKLDSDRCYDSLLRLAGVSIDTLPPRKHVAAINAAVNSLECVSIPWARALPKRVHKAFVRRLVDEAMVTAAKLPMKYYESTWVPGCRVLRSLLRARVDVAKHSEFTVMGTGNIAALASFKPCSDGYASDVAYDRFGTLTGRLTVVDGPDIHTLKREHRSIIVPSDDDHELVYVDFAALEARVLLYEVGRRCPEADLYGKLSSEVGKSREAVKRAVLAELYGSSKATLGATLGMAEHELDDFIVAVKQRFRTDILLDRLRSEYMKSGKITNRYGRPIVVDDLNDRVLVSYYAQSTGADVSFLGFDELLRMCSARELNVRPLYLLHDAILLDVPSRSVDAVLAISQLNVPGYVQKFRLRCEVMQHRCT